MAKGKHSTALFEVINRPARTGVAPPPVVSRAPLSVGGGSSLQGPGGGAAGGPAGTPAVQLDPDRHQISVRVSYTSALVTLFAVVVVVALAYLVGRGMGHGPQLANASTEDLKKGPANPAVMDVSGPAGAGGSSAATGGGARAAAPTRQQVVNNVAAAPVAAGGPVAAPTNVKRLIGVNYVIMQSYPDEATAKEAQGVLLSNGIACTVEKGPQGWVPMSWYSVIGTQSFERVTHNPQLEAYVKAIEGVKYGEKSKFKKFEPRAYRWK
jgi:hypothetical protein